MTDHNGTSEKINEVAQDVTKELRELGRELRGRAEDVRKEVVKQLNSAATNIRKEVRDRGADTETQKRIDDVAKGLEKAAHYLNNHSVEHMGEQATKVVRRNPMRTMLIAFAVGFLLGIVLRGGDKK